MTQPLKVLHVFSTFAFGGPQVRFATLANALGADYEHHLVAMDDRTDAEALIDDGVNLHVHHLPLQKNATLSFKNISLARRLSQEIQPDVLCTYNWGAIEWALLNRVAPIAGHLHFEDGFGPEEADGDFIKRRIWARKLALGPRTKVVVPSHVLERIARDVWSIPSTRVEYFENGIDLTRFSPEGAVDRSYAGEDEVIIGSVGALRAEKNLKRLVRVFHRAADGRNAKLVIVGDGPERAALEAEATERGISDKVVFTGRIDRPEAVMRGFDAFALSSDTEQMPIGLIEAMACGKACLSTDVGDVAQMVSAENRPFVVAREAEADFVAAMSKLIDDANLRVRLGAANRAVAEARFDVKTMVARLDALMRAAAR